MSEQDELVDRFVTVTKASRALGQQYLDRNNNDLMSAIEDFYATGPTDIQSSASNPKKRSGINTFKDLNDDDDDDSKTNTNFFTGGEKSGLQVEEPNKKDKKSLINDIFERARQQMDQPDDRPSAQDLHASIPKFTGTGFKLGDGETPSEVISDPTAGLPKRLPKAHREITFWKTGFTVADGALHRYDDPANQNVLAELNQGRVPISLLNVDFGQDVDVSVIRKTDEDYVPPKTRLGGFSGSGQRLGSPVPGEPITSLSMPASQSQSQTETETAPVSKLEQHEEQGDTSVQIRFANGKRITKKFDSHHSITEVYEFVQHHEYSTPGRQFILSHAFPVKAIENTSSLTIGNAGLKNAVIVQRWV